MQTVGKGKRGFVRYVTPRITELSQELDEWQKRYKDHLKPVLDNLFQTFYSYREHWSRAVLCVQELDALC